MSGTHACEGEGVHRLRWIRRRLSCAAVPQPVLDLSAYYSGLLPGGASALPGWPLQQPQS